MATDWTMELVRQTGLRITTAFGLPAPLQGGTARGQIEKLSNLTRSDPI
jgi:hypothetical protein